LWFIKIRNKEKKRYFGTAKESKKQIKSNFFNHKESNQKTKAYPNNLVKPNFLIKVPERSKEKQRGKLGNRFFTFWTNSTLRNTHSPN